MDNNEIELLPSGLATCLINNNEVRILKISSTKLFVRVADELKDINDLKVTFYIFNEYKYEEVNIKDFKVIEIIKNDFYLTYVFCVEDDEYSKNVRDIFNDYSKYIMLKTYSDDNEFSKEMVRYPAELDYDFYKYHCEQKKEWMNDLNYDDLSDIVNKVEMAIKIDNNILYERYLNNAFKDFKAEYLKENFLENHKIFEKNISRIYIGNEFCHNLFPDIQELISMLKKAKNEELDITLCFTYMRECYIEKTKYIIDRVYNWCKENNKKIEIVINDWGMIEILKDKTEYFSLSLGVLLNKRKKDPRYAYKNGYSINKERIAENSLNSEVFTRFLKENKVERYEYENCGYKISIAKGKHSMQYPFYVTNTSQYCTLYAMCTTMDRGNQKLVKSCPKYCSDYVFIYPKHLKMVGKYNSLFAFDDTLLKNSKELEEYINNGIDRIVLNFI